MTVPAATETKQVVQMTPEQLTATVLEVVKGMSIPEVAAMREEMKAIEKRALFPGEDEKSGLMETCGKSIIDTSMFYQPYGRSEGKQLNGIQIARQFKSGGRGPWIHLSPQMEKFAEILRVRGRVNKLRKFDLEEYNKDVLDVITKASGPLTTTDVGALVPIEFLATVIEFATAQSAILPLCWRLPMGSLTLRIPKLAQAAGSYFGGLVLYHPEEAGEKFETKPTFTTMTFEAKKLIGMIILTDELIADSAINIVNYVTSLFVRAFQWQTEREVLQGSGAGNQMLGILNDPAINFVTRQTLGTVQYEDIINLDSAIDDNFNNLVYVLRKATANQLRLQKDNNGQPVYRDGLAQFIGGAMPPTMNGERAIRTRNARAMGDTGDVILGDFGFYIWTVRQDMTIDYSTERFFEFDESAARFVVRQDGKPGVSIAFAVLDSAIS